MISFGAVLINDTLDTTFYGKLRPISDKFNNRNLSVTGFGRADTMKFDDPGEVMHSFSRWIEEQSKGEPMFISDNNGFDWQFINWYFHHFVGKNPFGYSSTNLGSLYKGIVKDMFQGFKHLRKTKHTHNPVDDSMGNAEALLYMKREMGLNIKLI